MQAIDKTIGRINWGALFPWTLLQDLKDEKGAVPNQEIDGEDLSNHSLVAIRHKYITGPKVPLNVLNVGSCSFFWEHEEVHRNRDHECVNHFVD